jgi:hypothetical protein
LLKTKGLGALGWLKWWHAYVASTRLWVQSPVPPKPTKPQTPVVAKTVYSLPDSSFSHCLRGNKSHQFGRYSSVCGVSFYINVSSYMHMSIFLILSFCVLDRFSMFILTDAILEIEPRSPHWENHHISSLIVFVLLFLNWVTLYIMFQFHCLKNADINNIWPTRLWGELKCWSA